MMEQGFRNFVAKNMPRFLKFLVVGGGSFLFSELILFLGEAIFIHPNYYALEITAMLLSVGLGYFLNDTWTSSGKGWHDAGFTNTMRRLLSYELIYALGNAISISIQLYLLYYHGLNVLLGNIIGAIVATPVNYVLTMQIVWRIRILKE